MKKFLALIIVLLLCSTVIFALVACDMEDDGIIITFKHTMGQTLKGITNDAIARFNKIYPNIKVVILDNDSDYDVCFDNVKKELNAGSENAPALTYCYPDHVAFYKKRGNIVALDSYIDSTEVIKAGSIYGNTEDQLIGYTAEQKADFIEDFYKEGIDSYGENKVYSMGFAKSSEAMFYNADIFAEHNLSAPTHWWCEGEGHENCTTSVEYVCEQLKTLYPNDYPLGYDSESNLFITLCEQYGAPYTSKDGNPYYQFNNEKIRTILARLNDWYVKGWFRTSLALGQSVYTSNLFTSKTSPKIYMSIGSTGGAQYNYPENNPFKVGVEKVPQKAGATEEKVIMQGPSICMLQHKYNRTEEQKMASWLLIKFLTTDVQLQAEFSMSSGYTPILQSVQEHSVYQKEFLNSKDGKTALMASAVKLTINYKDSGSFYTSPAFPGSSEARNQVETALVGAIKLTSTGATRLADIEGLLAHAVDLCEREYSSPNK